VSPRRSEVVRRTTQSPHSLHVGLYPNPNPKDASESEGVSTSRVSPPGTLSLSLSISWVRGNPQHNASVPINLSVDAVVRFCS
jgi:hypothetical protein